LFAALLFILTVATIGYLDQEVPTFNHWLSLQLPWAQQLVTNLIAYGSDWHIQPRWIIGGVFGAILLYFLVGLLRSSKSFHPPSPATLFFINLAIVLGIGTILTIYYWPEDTVRLGNFLQLQRGPRDKFLALLLHIGILVVAAHLLLFLTFNFWRLLFSSWRRPGSKPKETKIYCKPVEKE
jgi:glucan phosphoethanolaminetransferase (alkaline phosphatase superfamily)